MFAHRTFANSLTASEYIACRRAAKTAGRNMVESFFERPILNSPYAIPARHWELDAEGQPTNRLIDPRRRSELITPVPKPKKRRRAAGQSEMVLGARRRPVDHGAGIQPDPDHQRNPRLCRSMAQPAEPGPVAGDAGDRAAAPALAAHQFQTSGRSSARSRRWRPRSGSPRSRRIGARGRRSFWTHMRGANEQANPELLRIALKLATGAGKTTVMAMLIAWQTVNAVRHPGSKQFSRGFLIVAPGITIRDRLRVLLPNDPESYYREPRAGAGRHARRHRARQDRHHQLPRLQPPRAHGGVEDAAARCCRAAARS